MTSAPLILRLALTGALLVFAMGAAAQQEETPQPDKATPPVTGENATPYDQRLVRLAEILGSVHYLRNLCLKAEEDTWRRSTQELIDKEAADEPKRRERLTAAFNRGYRTFASVYTTCTEPATLAEQRYRAEGATLASEIVARFGN
ncbi:MULTISPECIES: TIGR02301 family protein [unclassified Sinorhizobium]|uniref:TIGR02301 family protein n=1 Tax=unclassified Sinorhizobium TaxID=2613772 RepID=UPI0024C3F60A|nr:MULTISPECIES: TIGR02301 family protein [unclassified Sinorhizobium]MDK1375501.1 TIGR02301 family protein [Sinorhizobium sp. 6-70]MDK1478497.1 TIGR02301 family protein [Sinorhizobium sp. 6-117]